MTKPHAKFIKGARTFTAALLASTTGAAAVMVGVAVPAVMGTAALGIDVGNWYVRRSELQSIADGVAASAALERKYGNEYGLSSAHGEAEMLGIDTSEITDLTINNPPTAGAYLGDASATEVSVTAPGAVFFAGLLFDDAVNITARAVATAGVINESCMVGLEETAAQAIRTSGNVDLIMSCGVASNSSHNNSVWTNGNVTIDVPSLTTAGGIRDGAGAHDDVPSQTNARRVEDPYDNLTPPFYSGCDFNNMSVNSSTDLTPGVYCGGLRIGGNSTVNLAPGEYIMDAGDFEILGNTRVYGTDVTIILTSTDDSTGGFKITGGSEVALTAPTEGDFAGVAVYQDPNADTDNSNSLRGNADVDIEGAVYLPVGHIDIGGNGDYAGECTQVIANSITMVGNADIQNNCDDMPIRPIGSLRARLVE
jgi:hypothetical protein